MLSEFDYYLDESDPDVVVLRRRDGTFVAAFSAQGPTREGILEAAEEDHARLVAEVELPSTKAKVLRGAVGIGATS